MCTTCAGTSYIRWGHDSCPPTATLIYKGSMAGAFWTDKGGGANHLCLPFDPQFMPGLSNSRGAYIHGSEYELVDNINSGKRRIQDRNVPCAVCRVQTRATAIMVPARNTCPRGWTREFYGFLMSGRNDHGKRDYVCIDREMRTLPGYPGNENGNTLYTVQTTCTSGLDCIAYQADNPLTCAMCTIYTFLQR